MSDKISTIDELLREAMNIKPFMTTRRMEQAKAQLEKLMAAERLDEITRAYGDGTKQHWSVIEYQKNRIAQLTRLVQAGGEEWI